MPSGLQPANPAATSGSQTMTNSFITANWFDNISFLLNKPMFMGYNVSLQAIGTGGSGVAVQWLSEVADTYSGHSNTTNPSRYVGQVPGWYWVTGAICFSGSVAGDRKAWISVNGTALVYSNVQGPPCISAADATTIVVPPTLVQLNGSTDYVELWAIQTSGAALNLNPNGSNASGCSIIWDHM